MDLVIGLIGLGFGLSFILLILLILLAFEDRPSAHRKRRFTQRELKKIKDQINGE